MSKPATPEQIEENRRNELRAEMDRLVVFDGRLEPLYEALGEGPVPANFLSKLFEDPVMLDALKVAEQKAKSHGMQGATVIMNRLRVEFDPKAKPLRTPIERRGLKPQNSGGSTPQGGRGGPG